MRRKIINIVLWGLMLVTLSSFINKENSGRLDVVYLDGVESTNLQRLSSSSKNSEIELDIDKTAYVLNKHSFDKLSTETTQAYLDEGGIILVNDNDVTYDDLVKKIDTNVAEFNYQNVDNQYGFYIFNNTIENIVVNVSLGYVSGDRNDLMESEIVSDKVDKEKIVNAVVTKALSRQFEIVIDDGGGGGTPVQTDKSGQTIAYGFADNYLYRINTGSLVASYTIYTQVVDVAKVKNNGSNITRGIYDISTTFTVDAESGWAVDEYSVLMSSPSTILDASFLNSGTSTTVSLGGSIGFQGSEIAGNINGGISYTYSATSQELSNNFPAGNYKYWTSIIPSPKKDSSFVLKPAIRVVNSNDILRTEQTSRVDSLYLTDNGWWIFENRLYMGDMYRKSLKVIWNSYGFIDQEEFMG